MGRNYKGITNLEEIKNRLDVYQIMEYYGINSEDKNKLRCPFHEEETPSFSIFEDGKRWSCFGECSTGGDAFRFILLKEENDFYKAVQVASTITGIEAVVSKSADTQIKANAMDELRGKLNFRFNRMTWYHSNEGKTTKLDDFLKSRCISIKTARDYGIGYVGYTDEDGYEPFIIEEGKKKGLVTEEDGKLYAYKLVEAGLLILKKEGTPEAYYEATLQDVITFPIYKDNKLVGFEGRRIDKEVAEKYGKYNKVAAKFFLFNSDVVYDYEDVQIFEGIPDTLSAIESGFPNSIGLLGVNNLGADEIAVLKKVQGKVIFHIDDDKAGHKRINEILEEVGYKAYKANSIGTCGTLKDLNELFIGTFNGYRSGMSEEEAFNKTKEEVHEQIMMMAYGNKVPVKDENGTIIKDEEGDIIFEEDEDGEFVRVGGASSLTDIEFNNWLEIKDEIKRIQALKKLITTAYVQFNGDSALLENFANKLKSHGIKGTYFKEVLGKVKREVSLKKPKSSNNNFLPTTNEGWVDWEVINGVLYKNIPEFREDGSFKQDLITITAPSIDCILKNKIAGREEVQISFKDRYNNNKTVIVKRDELVQRNSIVKVLSSNGFDITENTANNIIEYIRFLENSNVNNIKTKELIEVTGFVNEKTYIGRRGEVITAEGLQEDSEYAYSNIIKNENIPKIKEIDDEKFKFLIKEALPKILRLNDRKVSLSIVAWFLSAVCKEPLFEINKKKEFSLLNVFGVRGTGKTTITTLMQQLLGGTDEVKSAKISHFSKITNMGLSNAFPFLLDEYKISDIGTSVNNDILHLCKTAYNSNSDERGNKDKTTKIYPLTTPICVTGENMFMGDSSDAVKERAAIVAFSKAWLESHIDETEELLFELNNMNLNDFLGGYLKFILQLIGTGQFKEMYQRAETVATEFSRQYMKLTSRHIMTIKILAFGIEMLKELYNYAKFESDITENDYDIVFKHSLNHALNIEDIETSLDRTMQYFVFTLFREFDRDYDMLYDRNKNLLYIHQSKLLSLLENHRHQNKADIPEKSGLRQYLKESLDDVDGYIIEMEKAVKIKGKTIRCLVINTEKLERIAKIDRGVWSVDVEEEVYVDGSTSRVYKIEEARDKAVIQRLEKEIISKIQDETGTELKEVNREMLRFEIRKRFGKSDKSIVAEQKIVKDIVEEILKNSNKIVTQEDIKEVFNVK